MEKSWDVEKSKKLYSIDRWGQGYFSINQKGHVCVRPEGKEHGPSIDMGDVIAEMKKKNVTFPAVIRFHDILRSQVKKINLLFRKTIHEARYNGEYIGVFPLKVNQMREVIEEVAEAGMPYNFGLEAGSKAEILSALTYNTNPEALTILNGYKDAQFLKLGLLGRKLGRKVIIVVEKFSELPEIIRLARELNTFPLIGVRAKLSTKGSGKWAGSSGDKAKFGLTIHEILKSVELIKKEGLINCFKLFHFHIGSQVNDIQTIKEALTEAARIYAKLVKMGVPIDYFDVGGGLAVDYEGQQSLENSSMNYQMQDYVEDVVYILKNICNLEEVSHPHIVSESGRAISAHHSCVIFNVFGEIKLGSSELIEKEPQDHHLVTGMREILEDATSNNHQETFNDARAKLKEGQDAFKLGILDLFERAKIEVLYYQICQRIAAETSPSEDSLGIHELMVSQYLSNFSVFQSAIDSWSIGQVLPVLPLLRHQEEPSVLATLSDISCDSDGKIDCFIGENETKNTINLHPLKQGEPYYVGLFLTGAYQDIMGDNHNLFGRLNEVHIYGDDEDPEDFYIEECIRGDRAKDVLRTLQYNTESMIFTMKKEIEKTVAKGKIRPKEGVMFSNLFANAFNDYTYLRSKEPTRMSASSEVSETDRSDASSLSRDL